MALTVTEIEQLRAYLNGVMRRADHHAGNVKEIALALAGAILWKKTDEEPIKVMVREGKTTNVLWVRIREKRYAFSYDHETDQIDMRENSVQGPTLHSFTNRTSLSELYSIFDAL